MTNDPNDYRVPVVRLGDLFGDEQSKPAEYGDSAVTGYSWSTNSASHSSDIKQPSITPDSASEIPQESVMPDPPPFAVDIQKPFEKSAPQETPRTLAQTPSNLPRVPQAIPKNTQPLEETTSVLGVPTVPAILDSRHPQTTSAAPRQIHPNTPVEMSQVIPQTVQQMEEFGGIVEAQVVPQQEEKKQIVLNALSAQSTETPPVLTQSFTPTKPVAHTPPRDTTQTTEVPAVPTSKQMTDSISDTSKLPVSHLVESRPARPTPQTLVPADPLDLWENFDPKKASSERTSVHATPIEPASPPPLVAPIPPNPNTVMPKKDADVVEPPTPLNMDPKERSLGSDTSPRADTQKTIPTQTPVTPITPLHTLPSAVPVQNQPEPLVTQPSSESQYITTEAPLIPIPPKIAPQVAVPAPVARMIPTQPNPIAQSPTSVFEMDTPASKAPSTTLSDIDRLRARATQLKSDSATPQKPSPILERKQELARTNVQALQQGIDLLNSLPDEPETVTPTQKVPNFSEPLRAVPTPPHAPMRQSSYQASTQLPIAPQAESWASNVTPTQNNTPSVAPSLMRTFRQDVEQAVSQKGPTIVQMVAAQENARTAQGVLPPNPSRQLSPLLFVLLGTLIILILSGIGLGAWFYFSQEGFGKNDITTIKNDTIVTYDTTGKIRSEMMRDLVLARSAVSQPRGTIVQLLLTETKSASTGAVSEYSNITSASFFTKFDMRTPGALVRALDPKFFLGILVLEQNIPFLILPAPSYEMAFSGMLEWERTLHDDLIPLFPEDPTSVIGDTDPSQTPSLTTYNDTLVGNLRARVLKNREQTTMAVWAIVNGRIIVTTNEDALRTLAERVRIGAL